MVVIDQDGEPGGGIVVDLLLHARELVSRDDSGRGEGGCRVKEAAQHRSVLDRELDIDPHEIDPTVCGPFMQPARSSRPEARTFPVPPIVEGPMLNSNYANQNCSIARALEAVGERWSLLIVRELLRAPRRFAQLERSLGIAKNVLSTRLDKLAELDIVKKVPYSVTRDWNEYQLTQKGRDLFPVINALMAWGDTYEAPHGAPAVFRHVCGRPAGHWLVCENCGEAVTVDSIHPVPGPGFISPLHT